MKHPFRLALWFAAAATLIPVPAGAQALADPTRPPAALLATDATVAGAAGAPELQSVIISPVVKAAIINGQMVRLGGRFGSARLVRISESEVVLREGSEEQVLRLYPGVIKSAATGAHPRRAVTHTREMGTSAGDPPGSTKR